MKLDDVTDTGPRLLPEAYFLGKTKAWGLFVDRYGRFRRQFQVDIIGQLEDDILTLTEDFAYADGEKSRRVWEITVLGDGRYEGRADDVVGVAKGESRGQALHWEYDLNLPVGEWVWQVHFDDWMLRQDDDVVINRAAVSKFGVNLGQVILFFQKDSDASRSRANELGADALCSADDQICSTTEAAVRQ